MNHLNDVLATFLGLDCGGALAVYGGSFSCCLSLEASRLIKSLNSNELMNYTSFIIRYKYKIYWILKG